jgi:hypothetical protein
MPWWWYPLSELTSYIRLTLHFRILFTRNPSQNPADVTYRSSSFALTSCHVFQWRLIPDSIISISGVGDGSGLWSEFSRPSICPCYHMFTSLFDATVTSSALDTSRFTLSQYNLVIESIIRRDLMSRRPISEFPWPFHALAYLKFKNYSPPVLHFPKYPTCLCRLLRKVWIWSLMCFIKVNALSEQCTKLLCLASKDNNLAPGRTP